MHSSRLLIELTHSIFTLDTKNTKQSSQMNLKPSTLHFYNLFFHKERYRSADKACVLRSSETSLQRWLREQNNGKAFWVESLK